MTTDLLTPIKPDSYRYKLNKIVYINSAKHGYSEFPLNTNLAIFGNNNYGKTASLTGLKLLLFPYTNFKNQYSKFFFENSDGKYSDLESYSFYFPSEKSFIIMEAENKDGVFCTVLFKGAKTLEYGRYYVRASYEEIKDIFWIMDEDGCNGQFAEDLSLKNIDKKLKAFEAIRTTDKKQISRIMYSGHRGTVEESRFCTVPLQDNTPECISAFKSMYQSTFNSLEAQRSTLGDSMAHIIESQKSRKEERVEVDFDYIINEHNRLKRDKVEITNLRNNEPLWDELKALNEEYESISIELSSVLNRQYSIYTINKETIDEQIKEALQVKNSAIEKAKAAEDKLAETKRALGKSEGHMVETKKQIARLEKDVKQTLKILDRYGSLNNDDIEHEIRQKVAKKRAQLDELGSMEAATVELKKVNAEIAALSEKVDEWQTAIDKMDSATLSSLDEGVASYLLALNDNFRLLTGHLSDDASVATKQFTSHFNVREGVVYFDGKKMSSLEYKRYSIEEIQEKILDQIDEATDKDLELKKRKRELERFIAGSEEERKQKIKDINSEIFELNNQKTFIASLPKTESDLRQAKEQLESYTNRVKELEVAQEEQTKLAQETYAKRAEASNAYETVSLKDRDLDNWYNNILRQCPNFIDISRIVQLDPEDKTLSEKDINEFTSLKNKESQVKTNFNAMLSRLMDKVKIDIGSNEQFNITRTPQVTEEIMRKYYNLFLSLKSMEEVYKNEVAAHVKYVFSFIEELSDSLGMIKNTVGEINSELNKIQISNLEEIQLNASINKQFSSLLATAQHFRNKAALDEEALLPVEFYEELASFTEKFFDTNKKVLKMNMIIDRVDYKYKLKGKANFETKSQSGGTGAAISATIIAILLRKITPSYVTLEIPIVIDEIGTLDADNKKATIGHIENNGFSVFCATPDFSASLVHTIGNYIELDNFNVQQPVVADCNTLVLPSFIERVFEDEQ